VLRESPQGNGVVPAWLGLEHRAFAEPAAGRHPGSRRGLARIEVARCLEHAFDHAQPVLDRFAPAAGVLACRDDVLKKIRLDAGQLDD
jgi:hypothetical protein